MFIRIDQDAWRPTQRGLRWTTGEKLEPGVLVIWDRKPYRVTEVRAVEHVDWPEEYREAWVKGGMPEPATWHYRPMMVVVQHEDHPREKPVHLQCQAGASSWQKLPEHYSVCRLCHELPPCTHVHNEAVMERAGERMAEQMAILPGMCHACREPITRRQKSFTFPGANLIRPDFGDDSAVFHLRDGCSGGRDVYDQRWAKAMKRRRFFYCEGSQTVHFDKSTSCSDLECPGDVDHRSQEWHRPYPDMRGVVWAACWCLVGDAQLSLEAS